MDAMLDPAKWTPSGPARSVTRPAVGDLVGWRYGVWRVTSVHVRDLADLPQAIRAEITSRPATHHDRLRPGSLSIEHVLGPVMVEPDAAGCRIRQLGADVTVDVTFNPLDGPAWQVLTPRFEVCSCHGWAWPCIEELRDRVAARAGERLERTIAASQPGVCASCLEVITTRQKSVTFPEPSLVLPGAPGPQYHVGRAACFLAARGYEEKLRLPTYPDVTRLASCPGLLFSHQTGAEECTAGPACTDLHIPVSRRFKRGHPCTRRTYLSATQLLRPPTDCGFRGEQGDCLGALAAEAD